VLLSPARSAPTAPAENAGAHGRRSTDGPDRADLGELVATVPGLREELQRRSRASALLIVSFATVMLPAWSGFDAVLEPGFVVRGASIRLLCAVPMLAALWLLWRTRAGLRHPELGTLVVLTLVQLDIAWMATQVVHVESYVMGLSLALYGSGCILSARPRWTGALVAVTWIALAGAAVLPAQPMSAQTLTTAICYLGTASVIAMAAHVLRQRVAVRELVGRVRLEKEQQRTHDLLFRLDRLSHEDALTELANRRRWDAELSGACSEARAHGTGVAVVLIDVDHFKQVNDRHGHAGGDELLRALSAMLRSAVRGADLVARLGGDELAVLLPGADLARAVALAELLRAQACTLRPHGFSPGEVTLSLGVAAARGERAYPLELVSSADAQLYRAKVTRNCVGAPAVPAAG
jgi:diguanylate cyclase (GGDEF)-like protein